MAWRLATSLSVLRDAVNAAAPNRSKASDGAIGDIKHRARASRHNPNSTGVVTALDLTDDPANGCDIHAIAEQLRRNPHPNLAYIISNARIAGRSTGWAWHRYTGQNPHRKHAHFAVGEGPDSAPRSPYDDRTPWAISAQPGVTPDSRPPSGTTYTVRKGDTLSGIAAKTGTEWRELARINKLADPSKITIGQVIRLHDGAPANTGARTHTVRAGETLSAIGQRHGVAWREIQRLNKLPDPNKIAVGQVLRLP